MTECNGRGCLACYGYGCGKETNEAALLVEIKPGSKADQRLAEIERKLDHIFALLVSL